jgi:hypothetical protein
MSEKARLWGRWGAGVTGALFLPAVLSHLYLVVYGCRAGAGEHDLVALLLCVAVGVRCCFLLPLTVKERLLVSALYVPTAAIGLFVYSFLDVCATCGRCF